jgi:hypothetical protein
MMQHMNTIPTRSAWSRLVQTVACASTIACLVSMVTLFVSGSADWMGKIFEVRPDFHVGLRNDAITFYSDALGPYTGSLIQIDGFPPIAERSGFGLEWGIYYRYVRWEPGDWHPSTQPIEFWTLIISLWYPTILFAAFPAFYWRRGLISIIKLGWQRVN